MTLPVVELVLATSVLGLVPAARHLAARFHPDGHLPMHLATVVGAGALAAGSFLVDSPTVAALAATPWLLVAVNDARHALFGLASQHGWSPLVAVDLARLWWAVGALWLLASRAGIDLFGYTPVLVSLTAVHFHVAGVLLPVTAAAAAVRSRGGAVVPVMAALGVPVTAVGIQVGGWTETVAATVMALAGAAVAVGWLRGRGWLLPLAGGGLLVGMGLALTWAWGVRLANPPLGIEDMARWHGSINVVSVGGLALGALLARRNDWIPAGTPTMFHPGRPGDTLLARVAARVPSATAAPVAAHPVVAARVAAHPVVAAPSLIDAQDTPDGMIRRTWRRTTTGSRAQFVHAIAAWTAHEAAGVRRWPDRPDVSVGTCLALAIPVGPLSATATCRVIEVIDEPDRIGFTYRALAHHPERGDERFLAERDGDDTWQVSVTVVSREAALAARVLAPVTRRLQRRTNDLYLDGMTGSADGRAGH